MNEVSNAEDILDSRDVIERLEELGEDEDRDECDEDEYKALVDLADEASGSPDWVHGEALIRDSYFEDYAKQLAEDIGAIQNDAQWPNYCIDWERAARELQVDYFSVDFDGTEYWIRA